jgi:hypothetical protein
MPSAGGDEPSAAREVRSGLRYRRHGSTAVRLDGETRTGAAARRGTSRESGRAAHATAQTARNVEEHRGGRSGSSALIRTTRPALARAPATPSIMGGNWRCPIHASEPAAREKERVCPMPGTNAGRPSSYGVPHPPHPEVRGPRDRGRPKAGQGTKRPEPRRTTNPGPAPRPPPRRVAKRRARLPTARRRHFPRESRHRLFPGADYPISAAFQALLCLAAVSPQLGLPPKTTRTRKGRAEWFAGPITRAFALSQGNFPWLQVP